MKQRINAGGFTVIELVMAVAIVGTLSAIAIPNFMNSLLYARQKEAELTIATLQTAAMAFVEEYGRSPEGWNDIDRVQPVQTKNGAASGDTFAEITLMSGHYKIEGSTNATDGIVSFTGSPVSTENSIKKRNVLGCINTRSGLSNLKLGNKETEATSQSTDCK
ncbi:prepilin-type N-terminal cleavage/methylation domain-containing protein [Synechococcus sp. AH-736-M20]|nr:prepilin-type N-terminal cleavage/methylation domain-containing protein [Synechococcus sp. AH-736-M20]